MATIHQMKRGTQPTVLTGMLVERLAAVNEAARELRAMGLRVIREEVCPAGGGMPDLEIAREPGTSVSRLLDLASHKAWRDVGTRKRARVLFRDVSVTWWELS